MEQQKYLGVAIKYPVTLASGRPTLIGGYELINQSITDILNTPVGSRLFLREYGSRLHEMLFEPNDEVLEGALRMLIAESIGNWERRTKFTDVNFRREGDMVLCQIFHQPLASNEIQSFIYPFYQSLKF